MSDTIPGRGIPLGWRCSSLTSAQYARSSRLPAGRRAPGPVQAITFQGISMPLSTVLRIGAQLLQLAANRRAIITAVSVAHLAVAATAVGAQPTAPPASLSSLRALDLSLQELTKEVSLSVVQIFVTGYGPVGDASNGQTGVVIGPQHSSGSGVIIDAEGYIITNAHVVAGARRVQVVLPGRCRLGGRLAL